MFYDPPQLAAYGQNSVEFCPMGHSEGANPRPVGASGGFENYVDAISLSNFLFFSQNPKMIADAIQRILPALRQNS